MSDIKTVQIIGGAEANEMRRTRRNTRKSKEQQGGSDNMRGTATANITLLRGVEQPSVASTAASANPAKWLSAPALVSPTPVPAPSYTPSNPNQASAPTGQYGAQAGGSSTDKQIKVELRKSKTPKKVHLNPKKPDAPKAELHKKHKTRKVRKVTLGVSALHKRLTRAKKMREKVKEVPINELREQLVKKGLIKSSSKAPETVLRQIALDSQIVAGKAL